MISKREVQIRFAATAVTSLAPSCNGFPEMPHTNGRGCTVHPVAAGLP